MKILAIDPANLESAYCIIESNSYKPISFDKIENNKMFDVLKANKDIKKIIIEEVRSYGMSVGQTVFDTCRWYGRFEQFALDTIPDVEVVYICRKDVKMNLCGTMRAKDKNIIIALVDRFAPNSTNYGKGTKKNKNFFFGFKSDVWQSYALATTYIDKMKEGYTN